MEQEETQKQVDLPVIPRLDRLDLLVISQNNLDYIEQSHNNLSVPVEKIAEEMVNRGNLAAALEDVSIKGSIVERVASLEHRLLKLTVEFEEKSKSFRKSPSNSCSRCGSSEEKLDENNRMQLTGIDDHKGVMLREKEIDDKIEMKLDCEKRNKTRPNRFRYRKLFSWIQMGCSTTNLPL